MKTFAALIIVAIASSAVAGPHTTNPAGPLNLYIYEAGYGQPEGTGIIQNDGDTAFTFDGYTVDSASDLIDVTTTVTSMFGPLNLPLGIKDNAYLDSAAFPLTVGLSFLQCGDWVEMNPTPENYSDVTPTQGMVATLQPGGQINLGAAFVGLDQADGTFWHLLVRGLHERPQQHRLGRQHHCCSRAGHDEPAGLGRCRPDSSSSLA